MSPYSAAIAANRFGLGARPGDLATIGSQGPDWLLSQIGTDTVDLLDDQGLPRSDAALRSFFRRIREFQSRQQGDNNRRRGRGEGADKMEKNEELLPDFSNQAAVYRKEVSIRTNTALSTPNPFAERLVHFWSNHFTVSTAKGPIVSVAGAFEREAIRPRIFGRFSDLLTAVVKHPAMLVYLDNAQSFGPNSVVGRRRDRGLNENLAREILELHTVGVNGGYDQADVTSFAKALTGWTVSNGRRGGTPGTFHFESFIHEPGNHKVLDRTYKQNGIKQGEAILQDLSRHPSTADFIATKLARHFVADDPPQSAVDRLAKTFKDTDGDLATVSAELVRMPEAWSDGLSKFKTPSEFLISTLRAMDVTDMEERPLIGSYALLGQRPFGAVSPAGWPDTAQDWAGPDAVKKRLEWASTVGARMPSQAQPQRLAVAALGDSLSERTKLAIARAESASQGLTLLLMSPEFQRR